MGYAQRQHNDGRVEDIYWPTSKKVTPVISAMDGQAYLGPWRCGMGDRLTKLSPEQAKQLEIDLNSKYRGVQPGRVQDYHLFVDNVTGSSYCGRTVESLHKRVAEVREIFAHAKAAGAV